MMTLITIEEKKSKNSKMMPLVLLFCLIGFLIGAILYIANQSVFTQQNAEWLGLWSQSIYYAQLFFPILLSIIVSISCKLEHQQKNWQRMKTIPVNISQFILGKFLFLALLSFFAQLFFLICFFIASFLLKFPATNYFTFIFWMFSGWLGSLPIIAIQLWLSIKFNSFSTPILIDAGLSILGLMSLFVSEKIMMVFPYTQVIIGMRSRSLESLSYSNYFFFLVIVLVWTILGLGLSTRQFAKK